VEILLVRYTVREEDMDQILADFREMCDAVAETEPGCVMYRIHRDTEYPDALWLYEAYDSPESLEAHMKTPHFERWVVGRIRPKTTARERWRLTPAVEARR
jgi:quinol monooxygenase YgiN